MCNSEGKVSEDYQLVADNKTIILDATRATAEQVHEHIQRFVASKAQAMFVVESGFKNQQLGADKNPYGTIRIITKNSARLSKLYRLIKKEEKPILSPVSHCYRRMMKELGAVPITKEYLAPKPMPKYHI